MMLHFKSGSRNRYLLILLAGILLILVQGCISTYHSNKNWRRSPASTGHNRCGCLMQKPYELTPKPYGEICRA